MCQQVSAYMGIIDTDNSNGNLGFGGIKPHNGFSTAACSFCLTGKLNAVLLPD